MQEYEFSLTRQNLRFLPYTGKYGSEKIGILVYFT